MHPLRKRRVVVPSLVAVLWACGAEGTAPPEVGVVRLTPGHSTIGTSASQQFHVEVVGKDGAPLTGATPAWSSSDRSVATVDQTGLAQAAGVGSATIRAELAGVGGTAKLTVAALPASASSLQGDGQAAEVATELSEGIVVEVRDGRTEPVPGADMVFSASHGGFADPAQTSTDGSGRARTRWTLGGEAGTQVLTAASGDVVTHLTATAHAAAASQMTASSGDHQTAPPGAVLPDALEVRVTDAFGNPVDGIGVTFTTEDGALTPLSSATDADGRARSSLTLPDREGEVTVSAAGAGLPTVTFHLEADHGPLTLTGAGLGYGRLSLPYRASLSAEGGSGTGYRFDVIGGSLPPGIALSPEGRLTGTPAAEGPFAFTARVTDDQGGRAETSLTLEICPAPLRLGVGERWTGELPVPGGCGLFLPAGDPGTRYRVAVVRPTRIERASVVSPVTVSLTGEAAVATGHRPGAARSAPLRRLAGDAGTLMEAVGMAEDTERHHAALRREETEIVRRVGPDALLPDLRAVEGSALRALEPMPEKLRIDVGTSADCSAGPQRTALKLAEDDRVAIYQDSAQRSVPARVIAVEKALELLASYRDHGQAVIDRYFGGVSDIDENGRVVVYISPRATGSIAGFVWSGDLLSRSSCPGSNAMELIYLNGALVDRIGERATLAFETLVHEMKHVSSLYQAIQRSQGSAFLEFQPLWVEEGTAELAADVASRLAWHAAGGPPPHEEVAAQDVSGPGWMLEDYGLALQSRLFRVQGYLSSQPNGVIVRPSGAGPHASVYGSGWLFHRWLGDAYGNAGSAPFADAELFRTLNESARPSGIEGIESVVGRRWEQLLDEYSIALMTNGQPLGPSERGFHLYDFTSTIEVFCFAIDPIDFEGSACDIGINSAPVGPPGAFPWAVTADPRGTTESRPLADGSWSGPIGSSGVRVHEFVSNGSVSGAAVHVHGPSPSGLVVVRLH